jgi:hypothetical protein
MLRTIFTAALAAGLALGISPIVAAENTVAAPLQEVQTLAQWNEVARVSTSEPVLVLFVKADGSKLEQMLSDVAPEYAGRLKIVKIVVNKERASAEALSAAGSCSWSVATSDEDTDTIACADLFSSSPVRLTVYQGKVTDQAFFGDLLTPHELEQSLELSLKAIEHKGQAI